MNPIEKCMTQFLCITPLLIEMYGKILVNVIIEIDVLYDTNLRTMAILCRRMHRFSQVLRTYHFAVKIHDN